MLRKMKTRKIFEIITPEDSRHVSAFLRTLDSKEKKKISVQLETLKHKDCPLKPPMVKSFQQERHKGLFELRTRINKRMTRIIFCFDEEDNAILLHGFVKKQERETVPALETARARKLALADRDAGVTEILQGGTL